MTDTYEEQRELVQAVLSAGAGRFTVRTDGMDDEAFNDSSSEIDEAMALIFDLDDAFVVWADGDWIRLIPDASNGDPEEVFADCSVGASERLIKIATGE